jgi:hypothetical protein
LENSSYDPYLGYLAFGGIAPVKTTQHAVTVPVQTSRADIFGNQDFFFYSIIIDSYAFEGSTKLTGSGTQAVVDTGTTLNLIPSAHAKAYNSKFVPPARYDADTDTYFVLCNATVPPFAVEIGGKKFEIDTADNLIPDGTDSDGNEICISGTQSGGDPSDPKTIFVMCVSHFRMQISYFK